MKPRHVALTIALVVLSATASNAMTYLVGPTRSFTQLTQVAGLVGPGDVVLVDGGATYNPVVFENDGAAGNPITVRGVRVGGARPILAGGSNTIEIQSDHFAVESFEITGGSFRCVYHHSDDVLMRDLYVHDCPAHGLLGADEDSGSLTLEYSEFARAGNGGSQHMIYMSTDQIAHPGSVFRMHHCYLHDTTGGNAVKSRAERNEIDYNWIEGAQYHLLELIGPDEGAVTPPPGIREDSDVIGNVLIHKAYDPPGAAGPFDGNFYFVRVGSDMRCDDGGTNSTRGRYRFVNNTFVRVDGGTGSHVFRPFGYVQSIEMSNNVFYSVAAGALAMVRSDNDERCWTDGEQIGGQQNWVETGTTALPAGWTGTITGAAPGFVSTGTYDFRPAAGSPLLNVGTSTPTGAPGFPFPSPLFPPAFEPPQRIVLPGSPAPARIQQGVIDVGAFERPGSLFVDGFEGQSSSRWSATEP
ncbi:MAG: hypothetical protein ABI639_11865 [Thermoanaerobaculia bacterium]